MWEYKFSRIFHWLYFVDRVCVSWPVPHYCDNCHLLLYYGLGWRNIPYLLTFIHSIPYPIFIVWKNKIPHHFAANRHTFLGLSFHKLSSPLEVGNLINPVMYMKRCMPFIKWEVTLISCYYFETNEILSISFFFCLTCL